MTIVEGTTAEPTSPKLQPASRIRVELSIASVVNASAVTADGTDARYRMADLIERYLNEVSICASRVSGARRVSKLPIGQKLASKLEPSDFIDHFQSRLDAGIKPSSVTIEMALLRTVLKRARDAWSLDVSVTSLDEATRLFKNSAHIAPRSRRNRRPTSDELERLLEFFEKRDKRCKIKMKPIMEFALWSGRQIGEVCRLRWEDVNARKKTCWVRGLKLGTQRARDHQFPLYGKAWRIVQRQPRTPGQELVFPYKARSVSQRYVEAKKALGIKDLTLQDLRYEAAFRLFKLGHSVEQVAKVTGHIDLKTLKDIRDLGVLVSR